MPPGKQKRNGKSNGTVNSQAAFDRILWNGVCNILRRDRCKSALLYVPEVAWMLFLCVLDQREDEEEQRARVVGAAFAPALAAPYRWRDWARPDGVIRKAYRGAGFLEAQFSAAEQQTLDESDRLNPFRTWVNRRLFPHLRALGDQPGATARQKVIARIFASKEKTMVESEANLLDALDQIDDLCQMAIDQTHIFPVSQAFEGLLPRMGDKANDGGQFFTPREVVRAIVQAVDPEPGKTVYDPCCGTGGFLIEAYEHIRAKNLSATELAELKNNTFWGREDATLVVPITLANMALHGIDRPHIWHGNTLTGTATYDGLFSGAPQHFDYIVTNPPFGGKEGITAQARFAYKSSKTQILFLQDIIDSLADGGTCGMVIDEGVLFHTDTKAYEQTKRKLLDECDLWCVVSLPPNVFVNAGAASKTDLLFFTKGKKTEHIWYYDLSDRHVTKKNPLTMADFADFLRRVKLPADDPERVSERSWWIDLAERWAHSRGEAYKHRQASDEARRELAALKKQRDELTAAKTKQAAHGQDTTAVLAELEANEKAITDAGQRIKASQGRAQAAELSFYDLKAVNPNAPDTGDKRTPGELMATIRQANEDIAAALVELAAEIGADTLLVDRPIAAESA